jgi:hypothetical protein
MGTHSRLENDRSTWDALSYTIPPVTTSLVEVDRRFRYVYCSHHQGDHPAQVNHSRRLSSSRYFYPSFHGTRSIVAVFVKTLHTCARWIQSTLSRVFIYKIHFISISQVFFTFQIFQLKCCIHLTSTMRATRFAHLILFDSYYDTSLSGLVLILT